MHINTIYARIKSVIAEAISKERLAKGIFSTDYFGDAKNEQTGRTGLYLIEANLIAMVVSLNKKFDKAVITTKEIQKLANGQVQDLAWKIQSKKP
jgi:hypothetical protein